MSEKSRARRLGRARARTGFLAATSGSVALLAALSGTWSCQNAPAATEKLEANAEPGASAESASREPLSPYPPGRWRLMTDAQLLDTVVYMSHILVRHREVETPAVSFCFADWKASAPLPDRSRAEARALAEDISRRLQQDPSQFAAYAAAHSEDLGTAARGGSLGGRTALELSTFRPVLDALAAIEPGGVSRVVETVYGFHVLQRQRLPRAASVSGSHLVIGYDDAGWLRNQTARWPVPTRTRSEALELANVLAQRARRDPGIFPDLVREYSEHLDAEHGGDIGVWSTLAPSEYPGEIEVLLDLPVGGVSQPIDSLFGIEILQRTPDRNLPRYAMNAVILNYRDGAPDSDPSSRAAVRQLADSVARAIQQDPDQLPEFQRRYCCSYPLSFNEDPRQPEIGRALAQMAVGETSRGFFEAGRQFILAQRIDPESVPKAAVRLDLAFDDAPDVSYLLSRLEPEVVEQILTLGAAEAFTALSITEPTLAQLHELQRNAIHHFAEAADFEARVAVLSSYQGSLRQQLGADGYARYRPLLERRVEAKFLDAP